MTTTASFARLLGTALLALGAGCTPVTSAPAEQVPDGSVRIALAEGLVQTVSLVPASPVGGQNVEVRSVIVNNGSAAVSLESRICGLDFEGSLSLTHPPEVMKCAGYSMAATVAAGDSLVGGDLMRVSSAPGQYSLRVRHAVNPESWASLQVVVRSP